MSVDEERRISSNKVVFRRRKTFFFEGRLLSSKKYAFLRRKTSFRCLHGPANYWQTRSIARPVCEAEV